MAYSLYHVSERLINIWFPLEANNAIKNEINRKPNVEMNEKPQEIPQSADQANEIKITSKQKSAPAQTLNGNTTGGRKKFGLFSGSEQKSRQGAHEIVEEVIKKINKP